MRIGVRERREFRKLRTRKKLFGTPDKPRLTVHCSLKHIYAQLVDDVNGYTLVGVSTLDEGLHKNADEKNSSNVQTASKVGSLVGKKAVAAGVKTIVFDRGPYKYHGKVKALADAARSEGLIF